MSKKRVDRIFQVEPKHTENIPEGHQHKISYDRELIMDQNVDTQDSPTPSNPFKRWLEQFQDDFQLSWGWFWNLLQSAGAVIWRLIIRAPYRLVSIFKHIFLGFLSSLRWFFQDGVLVLKGEYNSNKEKESGKLQTKKGGIGLWATNGLWSFLAWVGRLVGKSIDLLGIGELADFLHMGYKFNTRPLSKIEIQEAKKVFGDSISYWNIRLDEWSLLAHIGQWFGERRSKGHFSGMAITIFNTIHFTRRLKTAPGSNDMAWLIHELTHVAQIQHVGCQIIGEALHAQSTEGYHYGGAGALSGRNFKDFNREQQGDIARDYYRTLFAESSKKEQMRKPYESLIGQLRRGEI